MVAEKSTAIEQNNETNNSMTDEYWNAACAAGLQLMQEKLQDFPSELADARKNVLKSIRKCQARCSSTL